MKQLLYTKPFFLLLLPVFFVWHGYTENYGLITLADCFFLLVSYFAAAAVLYGLFFLFYRNAVKASLLAGLLLSFYFFFGAVHDFLKAHTAVLHKYSVLLPFFSIAVAGLCIYLKRSNRRFTAVTFFFNMLLVIYLFFDAGHLILKIIHPDSNPYSTHGRTQNELYHTCNDCPSPDIYFFIFDEYSSTLSLAETFQYNNSALDSFLVQKGFRVQRHSFSNYNFTPFAMAAVLNMGYINGIRNAGSIDADDYENAEKLISNNAVINFMAAQHYDLVNYSIFDMSGSPSPVEESLLPLKTRLITKQTFFATAMRDIGWNLNTEKLHIKWLINNSIYNNLNNNNKLLQMVIKESSQPAARPRFIYTHLEMPHWPFYFDKDNRLRSEADLVAGLSGIYSKEYTAYLTYTNNKLKELVDTIQKNTHGTAAIIIMGDHGYRVHLDGIPDNHVFKNLNAVYFPGKDYHLLTDSISGVNQFRVVFNTLFKQQFPLLPDSAIFLTDEIK